MHQHLPATGIVITAPMGHNVTPPSGENSSFTSSKAVSRISLWMLCCRWGIDQAVRRCGLRYRAIDWEVIMLRHMRFQFIVALIVFGLAIGARPMQGQTISFFRQFTT